MSLFGPMDEIVSEKHEAQESINGLELARTQVLDVVDMARLGEEGFNCLALVVEAETALEAKLIGRQIGIYQEVFEVPFRQVELVQQAAVAVQRLKFGSMHQVSHGYPVLQWDLLSQLSGQARIVRFEQEIAGAREQQLAITRRVIACVQTINDLQCWIILAQDEIGITQQIAQALRT